MADRAIETERAFALPLFPMRSARPRGGDRATVVSIPAVEPAPTFATTIVAAAPAVPGAPSIAVEPLGATLQADGARLVTRVVVDGDERSRLLRTVSAVQSPRARRPAGTAPPDRPMWPSCAC
jgi:hypothetical protein